MDSFMGMYSMLLEHDALHTNPIVVLTNSKVNDPRRPYERQQCCVSNTSPNLAKVGPWHELFSFLSLTSIKTSNWLYSAVRPGGSQPRCFSSVLFGVSVTLNYYNFANTEAEAAERRVKLQTFLSWLYHKLQLPTPRPPPTDGSLRMVMVKRSQAAKRRLLNFEELEKVVRQNRNIHLTVSMMEGLSLRGQIKLARDHQLWVGIQGTNMFNAMFMTPNTSAAGLVLTCGFSPTSNWYNLLQHGAPNALVQYKAGDDTKIRRVQRNVPCKPSLYRSARVPIGRWITFLSAIIKMSQTESWNRNQSIKYINIINT
mmetsp:Transcript_34212/g.47421  ORF Transcript_34212/g.47421 Transcript_34212/m.47421 type:complete len:313 (+) Transcript_34212:132-1070(+)